MNKDNFNSNINKAFLWEFFQEKKVFDSIKEENFDNIKNLFETTINNIDKLELNLTEKNKKCISQFINNINIFNTEKIVKPQELNLMKYNKQYELKKDEFQSVFDNQNKLEEIDFTWKNDDILDSEEIELRLKSQLEIRNLDEKLFNSDINEKFNKVTFEENSNIDLKKNSNKLPNIKSLNNSNKSNNNNIEKMLEKILNNQDIIINYLQNKDNLNFGKN